MSSPEMIRLLAEADEGNVPVNVLLTTGHRLHGLPRYVSEIDAGLGFYLSGYADERPLGGQVYVAFDHVVALQHSTFLAPMVEVSIPTSSGQHDAVPSSQRHSGQPDRPNETEAP